MLNKKYNPLNAEYINEKILGSYKIKPIFETINSTNTYIKENIQSLEHGTVIIAKHQSSGRGRYDRSFESNSDGGIYCSFLLKDNLTHSCLKHINLKIACALRDSIMNVFNIETYIKWPNDLIINQKKCAGILIESQINIDTNKQEALIIGFGINVYKQKFSDALNNIATILEEYSTSELNRNDFLVHFFNHLDEFLFHNDIISYFKKYMLPVNSYVYVTINKTKEFVKIVDLNESGQLIVLDKNNSLITLFNEEISIL